MPDSTAFERVRYVAVDNGCIDLGSESRSNGILRSRREVVKLHFGEPDGLLLRVPDPHKDVSQVEYMKAFYEARSIKPPAYPEGHRLYGVDK